MYMLFNTDKINRTIFRVLVFAIIVSLIYDLFWFIIKHNEFSSSTAEDGGNETKLKQFILIVSYIDFILKVNKINKSFIYFVLDIHGVDILEGLDGLQ